MRSFRSSLYPSGPLALLWIGGGLHAIPIIGWISKSATMAAKAKVIGNAVIDYLEDPCPLPA